MQDARPTQLWWVTPTLVVNELLVRPNKKKTMALENLTQYAAASEKVMHTEERGTHRALDLGGVTQECGPTCTQDGIHFCTGVSDIAVRMLLSQIPAVGAPAPAPQL